MCTMIPAGESVVVVDSAAGLVGWVATSVPLEAIARTTVCGLNWSTELEVVGKSGAAGSETGAKSDLPETDLQWRSGIHWWVEGEYWVQQKWRQNSL